MKAEKMQRDIAIKHILAQQLTCPRCGKNGKLMQKTTISKGKYRYKKWYVYHVTYPNVEKPKYRKQKWCYLNEKQLGEKTVKDKIREIEYCSNLWIEQETQLRKARRIVCPKCKKELIIPPEFSLLHHDNVELICNKLSHQISFEKTRFSDGYKSLTNLLKDDVQGANC